MNRYQYAWLAIALCTLSAIGCTQSASQLPTSATDAEVQQMKENEQRVAAEEAAHQKQGM